MERCQKGVIAKKGEMPKRSNSKKGSNGKNGSDSKKRSKKIAKRGAIDKIICFNLKTVLLF